MRNATRSDRGYELYLIYLQRTNRTEQDDEEEVFTDMITDILHAAADYCPDVHRVVRVATCRLHSGDRRCG